VTQEIKRDEESIETDVNDPKLLNGESDINYNGKETEHVKIKRKECSL
jgi:hypothetical protein